MKLKGLRWYIIALIGLATVINYIDRSAINIMWPYIYKDFGIADADNKNALALITTFFMIAYALGQTLTGKLMDVVGTRIGMTISILAWSISISLHALAKSLTSFNIFRAMLGLSEAGNWPGATKSNAEWFPVKERAVAQGIFGAGASMGSVIAAPVIAVLYIAFGWKMTFAWIGLLGLIWIIPWLLINKATPDKHPWITEEEKEYILEKEKVQTLSSVDPVSSKQLLSNRNTWMMIAARFFIDPVWWLFVTWLPTFLKEFFAFDIKHIGAFAWFPYLLAAVGGIAGGYFSSALIKKGIAPVAARKRAITVGCSVMLLSLGVIFFSLNSLKDSPWTAIVCIGFTLFGFQFIIGNIQTLPADLFHGKNVGTVAGFGGTSAVLGTLIMIWLVPVITKTGYVSFFGLAALLVPIAWITIQFITQKNNYEIKR